VSDLGLAFALGFSAAISLVYFAANVVALLREGR